MPNNEHPGPRAFLLRVQYELYGQNCENGFWFVSHEGCGNTYETVLDELIALQAQFDNTIMFFWKDCVSQNVHFLRIAGSTKEPLNGPVNTLVYEALTGTDNIPALPGHDSVVMSHYLGLGGKMNRGRSYFSGVSQSESSNGLISIVNHQSWELVATELLTRFGVNNPARCWTYGLFHRKRHDQGAAFITSIDPILKIVVRREIRTERHRMLGHGA